MAKKISLALLLLLLLPSCIKISSSAPANTPVAFVTATLPPTKPGLMLPTEIPPTTSPTSESLTLNTTAAPACRDGAILLADVSYPDNTRL
ncbi:MAG TPA: hypothetical protein VLE49_10530, partial [Anaerolineales bacterium]|nr:hypothetical protein [Anaerolineales bacterium]